MGRTVFMTEEIESRIDQDLHTLCSFGPDRHVAGPGGEAANAWVAEQLADAGFVVERLPFTCVDWRRGGARLAAAGLEIDVWPGPYSPPAELAGADIVIASTEEELAGIEEAAGKLLFLHGPLVASQLTPRNYPFYQWDSHHRILGHLDRLAPAAIVAATGSNPGIVGALSPFPYIEDADFGLPSAYIRETDAEKILAASSADLVIDSDRFPTKSEQVVGILDPGRDRRLVICAHIDSRFGTPGALDNAAGVACILACARLIASLAPGGLTVEVLPFNGEDNFAAYGEMAYLESRGQRFDDIALAINVDAAGFRGHPTAVSAYGLPAEYEELVASEMDRWPSVQEGPQWPASDHMIFAMKGVPALALTTAAFEEVSSKYTHTERDVPDLVDARLLADAAEYIADISLQVDRSVSSER